MASRTPVSFGFVAPSTVAYNATNAPYPGVPTPVGWTPYKSYAQRYGEEVATAVGTLASDTEAGFVFAEGAVATIEGDIDALQTNINSVESGYQGAITGVQSEIATERARIDSILSGAAVELDTLKELSDAFTAADGDLQTAITNLASSRAAVTDALTSSLNTHISNFNTEMSNVQSQINALWQAVSGGA